MNLPDDKIEELKKSLLRLFERSEMISALVEIAVEEGHQLYLVGGFIRDILLKRRCKDIDFVTSRVEGLTKSLGRKTGARSVPIDQKFGTVRLIPALILNRDEKSYTVDLSPLRGASIQDDLKQRDFTINALAVDLSRWKKTDLLQLIDPLDGLADLGAGRLRACTRRALEDDPLRILRAYRLISTYGFTLDSQTREWIVRMRQGLDRVAKERIRDELALILSAPNSTSTLRFLDDDNIVQVLLPECEPMRELRQNDFHHRDVWNHTLSALEALESFLTNPEDLLATHVEEAQASLAQKLAGERTRETMLKLGVLVHDIGKPKCQTVDEDGVIHFNGHEVVGAKLAASLCSRLRFSNKENDFISQLVRQHMRAVHLFNLADPSRRSLGRFFGLGPALFWPLIMLFASDYRATLGPRSFGGDMGLLRKRIGSWLDFYYQRLKPVEVKPPLVRGQDLIDHLHLSPGPIVGKILRILTELQWERRINSREEALQRAAQLLRELSRK